MSARAQLDATPVGYPEHFVIGAVTQIVSEPHTSADDLRAIRLALIDYYQQADCRSDRITRLYSTTPRKRK